MRGLFIGSCSARRSRRRTQAQACRHPLPCHSLLAHIHTTTHTRHDASGCQGRGVQPVAPHDNRNSTCPTEDYHTPALSRSQPTAKTRGRPSTAAAHTQSDTHHAAARAIRSRDTRQAAAEPAGDKWVVIKITGFWWVHSGGAAASLPPPHKSALDGEHEPSGGRFIRRSRTGCGPGA